MSTARDSSVQRTASAPATQRSAAAAARTQRWEGAGLAELGILLDALRHLLAAHAQALHAQREGLWAAAQTNGHKRKARYRRHPHRASPSKQAAEAARASLAESRQLAACQAAAAA